MIEQHGDPMLATPVRDEDPHTRHRAARYVASNARDATDCAQLLDALGLAPSEGKDPR